MKHLLLALILTSLLGAPPLLAQAQTENSPPNLVFIMADDLGYGDVGAYGQTQIQTPNLDRMAAEGTRFTQFYAGSTVCAPSRSVLMTGQHTGHTPVRGNGQGDGPIGNTPLPDSAVTLAEVLRQAGYRTSAFGKWGLGGPDSEGAPWRQGFDLFMGYLDQRRAHFYYPEFLFRNEKQIPLDGNVVEPEPPAPGSGKPVHAVRYSHDVLADSALAFVRRQAERPEQPFFLYLPFTIPHAELLAPDSAYAPYLDADGQSIFDEVPYPGGHYSGQPQPRATLAAMISRLDRDVGRLLDLLRELELAENTLVFFTSDNGPHEAGGNDPHYFDSNGPLRGLKRDLYEGGTRVPMIAWGPGHVPAGQTSDHVWAAWDVLPTLADLAGTSAPSGIDGHSMVAAVTGEGEAPTADYLYWEFYERGSAQAVRFGSWKAVRQPMFTGEIELYNLSEDLSEARDVAADHPDVAARAASLMEAAHTPSPDWTLPAK